MEVISRDWLTELLSTCQRKEVGAVGARLYYPDDTVQHAGIIIGIGISYWIYHTITSIEFMVVKYVLPVKAILISIVFVMFIVGLIMRFSLNKINKQNIIETIRNENI